MNLPYIVNVAVILLACLAFYKLLLRRETFYKVNRFFLIACLAISFVLPLEQVPAEFSFRKKVNRESLIVNSGQEPAVKNNQPQTITTQQPANAVQQPLNNSQQSAAMKDEKQAVFKF